MNQGNSCGSKNFPKNAFSKLCDQALLNPWLKPLTGELENERERVAIASAIECEISQLDVCSSAYQPRMKNSIMRIDDFINNSTTGLSVFYRKQDSDNIRVVASNNDNQNLVFAEENRCSIAAKLGQYFTSKDIARKVAIEAMKFCRQTIQVSATRIPVFVEPSCGDGRILLELLNLLSTTDYSMPFFILAFDIDENVIIQCRDNLSKVKTPCQLIGMKIVCCDFLELTSDALASYIQPQKTIDTTHHLVFLGNPPYTSGTGTGTGKGINRNLPSEFIIHCAELRADFLSFVVPERSAKTVDDTKQSLVEKTQHVWNCHSHNLDESFFYFQGQKITQPSIIQCWSKA